jgi:hypothetical protein
MYLRIASCVCVEGGMKMYGGDVQYIDEGMAGEGCGCI